MQVKRYLRDDAAIEKSKTGKQFIMFSLAIHHTTRPGEPARVSFVEVEAWEQLAKEHKDNIKKGKKVRVYGRLRQDRWEENKKLCSRIKLFADNIIIL